MSKINVAEMPSKKVITLELAGVIADAALEAARGKGIDYLVISIVDDGGHLVTLSRQSGAEVAAVEIGIAKARTAAITRKPTQWWTDHLHGGLYAFLAMPGVTPVGGAHPIRIDGQVVGAISAAGGSFDVDNAVCEAALAILGDD